jgi:hypothetical protein
MFRDAKLPRVRLHPVVITGGHDVNYEGGVWKVPKRHLVGTIQASLQTGRVKFASQLPEAKTLASELQNFQLTITENANDTYEGRKGSHDDLVLAVALALWAGHYFVDTADPVMPETIGWTEFYGVRWGRDF